MCGSLLTKEIKQINEQTIDLIACVVEAEAVKAISFLWKRKHFEERRWKRKQTRNYLTFEEPKAEVFHIKYGAGMWRRKLEAEAMEAVKFLWKRKHFEERSWKRKQTRKRLTLSGAGSGSKISQECGSGTKLGSMTPQEELEAEAKNILLLPHPWF